MRVNRIVDARPYEAPKHFDMRGLRLQGFDASPAEGFWIGLSHFLPGGGAESDALPTGTSRPRSSRSRTSRARSRAKPPSWRCAT